jgi:Predicted transcriptional regulator
VPVRKSVQPDKIICLDCGLSFKAIKRHLDGAHGFTPEQYRQRWDLPKDYPIVAPNYSEARSQLAKKAGLGRKR